MSRTYKKLLLVLLVLYSISLLVQHFFPVENKSYKYEVAETLEWEGSALPFSYLDFGPSNGQSVVLMIPDPFIPIQKFERFSQTISDSRRVIIPLFPSENSEGELITHSPEARADILHRFLEKKGIDQVDLIGHGFGNAVAIQMLEKNMRRSIRSYSMISAIGVQEFHFLGYHVLNQPIYTILYPVGWLVDHGLPLAHWKKHIPIDLEGARFLNKMDQRAFRDILSSVKLPVHILHSEKDRQISVNTAREHHRLIPQSSIVINEGDHSAIHDKAVTWARSYNEFLSNVDAKTTPGPGEISAERIELAKQDFNFGDVPPVAGWAFFMLVLLLTIVTLISEDLGCIGAGLLAAGNVITIWAAFLVIFVGILVADSGIYWLGRIFGRPIIQKAPFKWLISRKDIDWTAMLFKNNGFKIILGSRFLPGTRFPTYFSAGVLQTAFPTFFIYFLISILIWTPLVLGTSIIVGQQMLDYLQIYQEYAIHIFFTLVIVLYFGFKLLVPLSTKKGRKELAVYLIRLKQRVIGK
ncbi:VTT domain-containing protein [Rhodohalobacter sp. 8-1]|uniref:VTT domain-containing protein n=1 Tax=Rhodohalobacter sp. 8-1 TaxID=3131972 RepID=UPI0030EC0A1E